MSEYQAAMYKHAASVKFYDKNKEFYHFGKRIMDVALAIIALVILAIPMMLVALAIKLTSRGPIIFVQERVGSRRTKNANGEVVWEVQTFRFYKFRSMTQNADESAHAAFITDWVNGNIGANAGADEEVEYKMSNDPRITPVGKIIRKTSIDELPQLFNILKGEMSFVGPRPVPVYEFEQYQKWHRKRMNTLPGLTGLFQVEARGRAPIEEQIRMDLDYIYTQSLWGDIKIILRTVPAVLSGRGAK